MKIFIVVILEGGILSDALFAFRLYLSNFLQQKYMIKRERLEINIFLLFSFSLLDKCYTIPGAT